MQGVLEDEPQVGIVYKLDLLKLLQSLPIALSEPQGK